jgi:multimeric flavodoxin WrbA
VILGINASGRKVIRNDQGILVKGVTDELLKHILKETGEPYEYVHLGGKTIKGCQACLRCASDNICKVQDDWAETRDMMLDADAVVFGAPLYYGTINALGHAFLERTFSLRHKARFPLTGKPNAILTVGTEEPNSAEDYIKAIFRSNYMASPIGILRARGIAQCYTCGYGEGCPAGAVVSRHGFLDEIKGYHIPRIPQETYQKATALARRLGLVVKNNA